jgi:adenine-specific DNA-methyltransferase
VARQATRTVPARHQKLPSAGAAREALREKGQFWTPDWVAQAMVGYVLRGGTDHIFDPAVGAGAFFRAAKTIARRLDRPVELLGAEIDAAAIEEARQTGLATDDLEAVEMRNFVLHPPTRHFAAIVANPPYIRHHRLPHTVKLELKNYGKDLIGTALDGRAGLHIYFLLRALERLEEGGRLAFILPADTCEGKSAPALWGWITRHYRLDAVVTFAPEATPFPAVDTNALVFLIHKAGPLPTFRWVRCTQAHTDHLTEWTLSNFETVHQEALSVRERHLSEALQTGLSRPPAEAALAEPTLSEFAYIRRGIATGHNDFFFLTKRQARDLGIPDKFLRLAVGRTRDVTADSITTEMMERLEEKGRPTRLLALDSRPVGEFPSAVREYVIRGEEMGLPGKPLISQRKPWYKMEVRDVPPFLFAYLGRRNVRFIRNTAGVLPLTCLLCVYPRRNDPVSIQQLWTILSHPDTVANLSRVGKSYGAGAIKVEPRALERLPIPSTAIEAAGAELPEDVAQLALF